MQHHRLMTRALISIGLLASARAAVVAASLTPIAPALVLSLPSVPNPPENDRSAGRLVRGTRSKVDPKAHFSLVDPIRALTEAALNCGQRQFSFRGLGYDHGKEMALANSPNSRRALVCIASKVPFDFYVRTANGDGS